MLTRIGLGVILLVAGFGLTGAAYADDPVSIDVTLKDHRFTPAEIHIPAGHRAELRVRNEDPTPEEFDSSALKVEKVIAGGSSAIIHLRPLGPGRFPFMGEFNPETANGVVVAD
jgi:hypothetical protein